ncbi:phenylacetic acid degradation protein PaaN [Actinomadura sp. ATCC 31491]|uniref:Phenylacetic acid degradation protein PaaN n=1 Tax=Actinomadura luzonensis TaxID=2805427 RepID=A0ABT0FYX9_9ACTN|nr:phenylacetic acid degradation protein PaaN [Actinomadura luzonensis]MCK2217557.1 phenylacetic acid degradation protein PaaN [Actinomadura luzonensis]
MFEQHRDTLEKALAAIAARGYWSAYPESPSPRVYGEGAAERGKEAFESYLGKPFPLEQPGTGSWIGAERSPYGMDLGVTYPEPIAEELIAAAGAAMPAWRDAGPEARALTCVEIVNRINRRSFELAHAVQHTTGQAFVMAFQAGGPHAQDRALEAVAYGLAAMTSSAASAHWEKPAKGEPLVMDKRFTVVPRGVAVVIGCNTFPTWNAYPGLFASLVTGNPVIVKPHPRAILPLAITVLVAREVLAEAGFDPALVSLAAEEGQGLAKTLATHPAVRIVDYTGSTEFGDWLERNARQALVHTEKAGVNAVVIDSTGSWRGMLANLAFSLSLYSGQMCTAPQNVFVPAGGIETDEGHKSFEEVAEGLAGAVGRLLGDDAKAVELTGAIVNPGVLARVESAGELGETVLEPRAIRHPAFPDAVVRTPAIVRVAAADEDVYGRECFGPVSFLIPTASTGESLDLLRRTVKARGALTASVYSTSPQVLDDAERAALDAGVNLSCNLTGGVFVNQSAAFSDYHGTGANPAATASLTDPGYVAGRFSIVQSRRPT